MIPAAKTWNYHVQIYYFHRWLTVWAGYSWERCQRVYEQKSREGEIARMRISTVAPMRPESWFALPKPTEGHRWILTDADLPF